LIGVKISAAKNVYRFIDSVMTLFVSRLGSCWVVRIDSRQPTVVDCRQDWFARHESDKL
jgi:hypothetical protein